MRSKHFLVVILFICTSCNDIDIEGCPISSACNYSVNATINDGSCTYRSGCNEWCIGDEEEPLFGDDCIGICGKDCYVWIISKIERYENANCSGDLSDSTAAYFSAGYFEQYELQNGNFIWIKYNNEIEEDSESGIYLIIENIITFLGQTSNLESWQGVMDETSMSITLQQATEGIIFDNCFILSYQKVNNP